VNYVEHVPPAALAPWLECAWEREGDGGAPVRVLPDGCIDVVWTEGMGTQLIGPNTTAFLVTVPLGARVHGVRLRPGGAPLLLGIRPEELRDVRAPIEEICPSFGRHLATALAAPGGEGPRRVLIDWLHARSRGAGEPDPIVAAAVTQLQRPGVSVRALAAELAVSERSLHRRVRVAVGYGPKRLARVLRLQRALSAARLGEDLARVAFESGYADQSHFTNECRGLAGASPAVLISS
jgi:AraC-like DNA-binding protein